MKTLNKTNVPKHLQKWVVDQNYEKYSAIDQAVWRYVMRQNHTFLKDVAHDIYTEGLKNSGISIESIPRVEQMNDCLAPFGWGSVTIDGFIPAVAFFSFQANGILPIASEIRKLKNILYTPAPDIIHEAAGHAPILCDEEYSEFVKLFGSIGSKAIATKEEHAVFEAARALSELMEDGSATDEEINKATSLLEDRQKEVKSVSEAEKIARLYWWTVEFGMIGTVHNPKIYGAGLLSSVGESKNSLTDNVKKRPFNVEDVINTGFDISKQQPHLFVCESFSQLKDAVLTFAESMAFKKGGTESLQKALNSSATATVVYNSGIQVSGTVSNLIYDEHGEAIFFQTEGPTALAWNDCELANHGTTAHAHGFSSPIGTFRANDILTPNRHVQLTFESGIDIEGTIEEVISKDNMIILISFSHATVIRNGNVLFVGQYDMAVGSEITSVFGGAADPENFFHEEDEIMIEENTIINEPTLLETLYENIRNLRERENISIEDVNELKRMIDIIDNKFPEDWLLRLEIIELLCKHFILMAEKEKLQKQLDALANKNNELKMMITNGLKLIS